MTSRRPASAGQFRSYGRLFTDGERVDAIASITSSKKIGGMARNEAWSHNKKSEEQSRVVDVEQNVYIHRVNSGLNSAQKRAASYNPGDVTKPIFLKRAMNFINEELRIIGASRDAAGSPRRFQVFSQVFEQFIQEFRTYQPLLSEIKREYEVLIDKQKTDLGAFEIVKSKLSVMEYKMDREVEKITDRSRATIEDILKSKQAVVNQVQEKNALILDLQKKIDFFSSELKRVEKENQKKPELLSDVNELKAVAAEFSEYERKTKALLESKDNRLGEFVALNSKLQMELLESTSQLGKLKASTAGLTKEAFKDLQQKLAQSEANRAQIIAEKEKNAAESLELAKTLKDTKFALKSKMSQSPDWEYIQSQFTPSVKHFSDLAKKLDYNDAIVAIIRDVLKTTKHLPATPSLREEKIVLPPEPKSMLAPSRPNPPKKEDEYFIGKGVQSNIPKYLRTKQKVLNRHLSRHNILLLINDTWEAKTAYEASNSKIPLGDFLYMYLKKRFGNQEVICEWGYNLMEACAKYKESSLECMYFLGILNDDIGEEVFSSVRLLVEYFRNSIYRWDVKCNFGTAKGFLEKSEFIQLLNQLFPEKSRKQIQSLEEELNMDQPSEMIIYRVLFDSEADSQLLQAIKSQMHEERENFIKEIEQATVKISRDDTMSAFEAGQMMQGIDPKKTQVETDKIIARGFGVDVSILKPKLMISKTKYVENLKKGVLIKGNCEYL